MICIRCGDTNVLESKELDCTCPACQFVFDQDEMDIKVSWKWEIYDAILLDSYRDADLENPIIARLEEDAPGLRDDDNLVCVPGKDGIWKGLFPIQ